MYKHFVAPEQELTLLNNVLVDSGTALIVDLDGQVLVDQADEVMFWQPTTYGRSIRAGSDYETEFGRRLEHIRSNAEKMTSRRQESKALDPDVNYIYMLHPFRWHAFGHLFDSLQRLYHTVGKVPEPWKVLHSRTYAIKDFDRHMNYLGVKPEQAIETRGPYLVPQLWVSPWQAQPAQLASDTLEWIFQSYTKDIVETEPQRLYLTRNHVRPGTRSVLNEPEVLAFLETKGFTAVTGSEPLEEIVTRFYNAECIIGAHGSMFANCMFSREHCRVLEFCADNRKDFSFRNKRKKVSSYSHVLLTADADFNFTIPLEHLAEFV